MKQPFQNHAGFVFTVAAAFSCGTGDVTCRAGLGLTSLITSLVKFWWDEQCQDQYSVLAPLEIISYHRDMRTVMF